MIVKYDSKIKRVQFSENYINVILEQIEEKKLASSFELSELAERFKERFFDSIVIYFEKIEVPMFFSEAETAKIISNFMYIVGYYMYENIDDIFFARSYIENFDFNSFEKAIEFYNEKLKYMENTLKEVKKENNLNLTCVNFYLDKLLLGVKMFSLNRLFSEEEFLNLPDISLDDALLLSPDRKIPDELYTFSLEEKEMGFYENLELVEKIKAQFEFLSKFDSKRIVEIYTGIPYDYTPNGKMRTWYNLITPILIQTMFCSEYSDDDIRLLKFGKVDFDIMLHEASKFIRKVEDNVSEFYIVSFKKDELKACVKTEMLELDFDLDEVYDVTEIFSKFSRSKVAKDMYEAPKTAVDILIGKLLNKKLDYNQREYLNNFFGLLTKNIDKRINSQIEIDEKYNAEITSNFLKSELFESLTDATKSYISSKLPNIGNKVKEYFEGKRNYFCLVD